MIECTDFIQGCCIPFLIGTISGAYLISLLLFKFKSDVNNNIIEKVDAEKSKAGYYITENLGVLKMTLVVRNDLKISKGEIAAQCSHAAILAHEKIVNIIPKHLKSWKLCKQKKIIVKAENEQELLKLAEDAKKEGLINTIVGLEGEEHQSGTRVVLAVGPGPQCAIDKITSHLKLY